MYEIYDLAHEVPFILSVIVIITFFLREYACRRKDVPADITFSGIPRATDYYTCGGHLVRMVKQGQTFRAYLTEDIFMPDLRRDRFGKYIETGCFQEEDAEMFVDQIL